MKTIETHTTKTYKMNINQNSLRLADIAAELLLSGHKIILNPIKVGK